MVPATDLGLRGVVNRVLDRIWIGTGADFLQPLGALGFVGAVDLRDASDLATPVPVFRLAQRDGDPWIESEVAAAYAFVYDGIQRGKVIVACDAGMSRSASMVVGFLVRCGWDAPSALAHVLSVRSVVRPKAAMLEAALRTAVVK